MIISNSQINYVFERHEKKYLLNPAQYTALAAELTRRMQVDQYGEHTISTLYYDTEDYSVARHCIDNPALKVKLRLRSYGTPKSDSLVFLELKKKLAGITYKRRVCLTYKEAAAFMDNGELPDEQTQIFHEVEWYANQQPLAGKILLFYDRVALVGNEDPHLRITFDANIRWRDCDLDMRAGTYGSMLLPRGYYLMEIKPLYALPYWLAHQLSELKIFPVSFSKFTNSVSQHLESKEVSVHAG